MKHAFVASVFLIEAAIIIVSLLETKDVSATMIHATGIWYQGYQTFQAMFILQAVFGLIAGALALIHGTDLLMFRN